MFSFIKSIFNASGATTAADIGALLRGAEGTDSGVTVNADTAIKQATVFSCVRVLSDSVAQLPCRLAKTDPKTGEDIAATGNPLYTLLKTSPCPSMTAFDYWKFNVTCMALRGFHISKIIKNVGGKVTELMPINPAMVNKIYKDHRTGELKFDLQPVEFRQGNTVVEKRTVTLTAGKDAFVTYYGTIDGVQPMSPISMCAESVGLAITATKHGASVFKNDATPPIVVEMPQKLNAEQAKRFVESWLATGSGARYGLPRILESGAKVQKISMSNQDAQYLETRQFQTDEIAGIFGVPPHMVGSRMQAKGWSTMEQLMSEFVILSLNPWTVRLEMSITKNLIPRDSWLTLAAKFMTNALLRGDSRARAAFYKELFGMASINPNEIRRLEDMNPRTDEDGDQYYVSANVKTPDQLANPPEPPPAPAEPSPGVEPQTEEPDDGE